MIIVKEQLAAIMPNCSSPYEWAESLNGAMDRFAIARDPDRIAAFLAQCAHESMELTRLQENLNYSAERLAKVWPKRFTFQTAQQYAHAAVKLANSVYADRLGNGPETSGDGWRFRGRGIIMLTGRSNYAKAARALDLPLLDCPDSLCMKSIAALTAAWFWQYHGLNPLADDLPDDNDESDYVSISRVINGGVTGLESRRKYWLKARQVFGLPGV